MPTATSLYCSSRHSISHRYSDCNDDTLDDCTSDFHDGDANKTTTASTAAAV